MASQVLEDLDIEDELNNAEVQHAVFKCWECPNPTMGQIVETCCKRIRRWRITEGAERCPDCYKELPHGHGRRCVVCGVRLRGG